MSFDGDAFNSYATTIARHITHKGKAAILLNTCTYSSTTAGHYSYVRDAIPSSVPVFYVDGGGRGSDLIATGEEIFDYAINKAADAGNKAEKARQKKDFWLGQQGKWLERARFVSQFYGLRKKVDEKAIERLATAKAKAEKRERIAREAKAMRDKINQQLAYDHWLNNEPNEYFCASLFPVAFRVEGDELVSTLGARVPLQAARVAYRFAMSKRGQAWRENGETCPVGHYRLNAINEHGIVAGCHRIAWSELERLASILA